MQAKKWQKGIQCLAAMEIEVIPRLGNSNSEGKKLMQQIAYGLGRSFRILIPGAPLQISINNSKEEKGKILMVDII
jgi:hypothetical protein